MSFFFNTYIICNLRVLYCVCSVLVTVILLSFDFCLIFIDGRMQLRLRSAWGLLVGSDVGFAKIVLCDFSLFFQLSHVVLHLFDLTNESDEVSRHCGEEVYQRAVDLLHLLLNTNNSLLELLTERLGAGFNAGVSDKQLLWRDIRDLFWLQLDVVVGAALIDNFDMWVLVLHDFVFDRGVVAVFWVILDFSVDLRILGEYFAHQELLG